MEDSKSWMRSKTVWSALVVAVIGILSLFGVGNLETEKESITEIIMQLVTVVGGIVAIYGRVTAKTKIAKTNGAPMILICILLVGLTGCSSEISTQKQQCLVATKVFTGVVEELTLCKQLGLFSDNEKNEIGIIIEGGQNCLNQWHEALKDPNTTTYDQWPLCVNEAVIKLLTYESRARGGDNQ